MALRIVSGNDTKKRTIRSKEIMNVNSCAKSTAGVLNEAVKVGIDNTKTESASSMLSCRAEPSLKVCRPNFRPPTKNATPITRRMLAMIEPTIAAFTIPNRPAFSANRITKISGKFPSIDWSNPFIPRPIRSLTASTLRTNKRAIAPSAIAEIKNETTGLP